MLKLNTVRSKMAVVAAISGLSLMGCGGGGTANISSVSLSSSITPTRVTNSTSVTATGTPSNHTFGTTSAVLPANIPAPVGEVTIVTTDTLLANVTGSGDVLVNGNETGLTMTDGHLSGNLALPTDGGPYSIQIGNVIRSRSPRAAFILTDGTHELWVKDYFVVTVGKYASASVSGGYLGVPTYGGRLPSNGTSLRGAIVTADASEIQRYGGMSVSGYTADLTINWTSGGQTVTFHQQRTFDSNGKAVFSGLSDAVIPADGVDNVSLELSSTPVN